MINFGSIGINRSFKSQQVIPQTNNGCYFKNTPYIFDSFVNNVEQPKALTKEQKVQKLYDETYNEVLLEIKRSNPIISEMNLPKPTMRITDFEDDQQGTAYNFSDNEILLPKDYDKDLNLFISKNTDGTIERLGKADKEDIEKIKEGLEKEGYKNVEVIKFTQSELDFKIKETIAHELRHYFQQHLIASTKTASKMQTNKLSSVYDRLAESKQNYIDVCKKEGIEPEKEFAEAKIPTYWKKYKPKKMFNENLTIKYTADKNDKRLWSVTDDFYSYSEDLMSKDDTEENYYGRPTEIDAYNFEYEYINKFAQNYNVSPEAKAYMADEAKERRDKGIEYMTKNGHNFKFKE